MSWWYRLLRGELRTAAVPAWTGVVGERYVDTVMDWPATDDFHTKQGRSTGRVVQGPLSVYLKRHWRLPVMTRLLATLVPRGNWSPAAAEWEHLQWARAQGLPVPEPLAFGERAGPWLRLHSFLVIRALTGLQALHQAVPAALEGMRPGQFRRWKAQVVRQVAALARRLHEQDRYHKDLYLCHFYVPVPQAYQPAPGAVHLIDLHRLGHHCWLRRRWRVKDLAQLLFSTWGVAGVTNRDRLDFLRAYLGTPFFGDAERALVRAVVRKARRYARHNGVTRAGAAPARGKAA
jgi:heptose I phosphotransferase